MAGSEDKLKKIAKDTSRKPTPGMLGSGAAAKAGSAIQDRNKKLKAMLDEV